VTERVSVATGGAQANYGGDYTHQRAAMSPDGRYVLFATPSTNLDATDTNGVWDVYLRDRQSGTTTWVSLTYQDLPGDGHSGRGIAVSADGRYVAFDSGATNMVAGDTNGAGDVFVRDRQNGTTEIVSVATGGAQANDTSEGPVLSADGRFVAFESPASNLVPGDTNGSWDVFVHDRVNGTTERVSVSTSGGEGDGFSSGCHMSADGRLVAFTSTATNLVPGDTNGTNDVFVRDLAHGTTRRVSVAAGGVEADGGSGLASLSADGRYVVFTSYATNLVPGDTNGWEDVFLRDLVLGTIERVSLATGGAQANYGASSETATISDDGRSIAFVSYATDLVPGDTNGTTDVFVYDRTRAITERVSVGTGGTQTGPAYGTGIAAISGDGRFVVFRSYASHLVPGDTNQYGDVFVHDRHASGFTSLCEPGAVGVSACPCLNVPTTPGSGCDNSAATGGAALAATGTSYLSFDGLVLTTSGELPTATSIVVQGDVEITSGAVFGQGVRCVGGNLLRLYVKTANAGSITAPDTSAGDPSVSTRSAQLGDPIAAGASRYYFVAYRDPIVLGGCPGTSTFNATQTGEVAWSP
jgi:Tol biopolymer transport system component